MFFYRLLSIDVLWFQILESRVQLTNGSFLHLECWCISSFSIQRDLIMQNRFLRKKMYWFAGVWVLKCLYDFNHSFVFTVLLKPWSQLNGSFKTPFMVEAKTGQTALSQAAKSWKRFTDTKARCTFREIFTSFMSQIIDPLVVSAGSSHTVSLRIHRTVSCKGEKIKCWQLWVCWRTSWELFWSNSCELKIAFCPIPMRCKYFRIF